MEKTRVPRSTKCLAVKLQAGALPCLISEPIHRRLWGIVVGYRWVTRVTVDCTLPCLPILGKARAAVAPCKGAGCSSSKKLVEDSTRCFSKEEPQMEARAGSGVADGHDGRMAPRLPAPVYGFMQGLGRGGGTADICDASSASSPSYPYLCPEPSN